MKPEMPTADEVREQRGEDLLTKACDELHIDVKAWLKRLWANTDGMEQRLLFDSGDGDTRSPKSKKVPLRTAAAQKSANEALKMVGTALKFYTEKQEGEKVIVNINATPIEKDE